MGGVYKRTHGVEYRMYKEDSEEPDLEFEHGELEELHYEKYNGTIYISFVDERGGFHSLSIPIRANATWNGFVNSLPTWDL